MELKYNGQYVFRTQRSAINPESETKKEDTMKVNLSQQERGRWGRLITLIETFFSEQLAFSNKPDFQLQQPPQTELAPLSAQERGFLNDLFKVTVGYFQTGADISAIEGFQLPTSTNEKNKEFVQAIRDRVAEEKRQLADAQPDPPEPVLLERTESQKEIDQHYDDKRNTITSESGREAYLPPPVLLAEREETK